MPKPSDRRPMPSRRDVIRIAQPGSLIVVYDDLLLLVITWTYRVLPGTYVAPGHEPEPQHYCELLIFDPKNREHLVRTDYDRDRIHSILWTTVSHWLFDRNNDLVSEVIDASDPER